MQKITPHLWFNSQAEEAVNYYTTTFPKSKIIRISYYDEAGAVVSGRPPGSIMTISFILQGENFMALNGGPVFQLTPAISFLVSCGTQKEIDYYWDKLSKHGKQEQCGWLQDQFGVSWQIVPKGLAKLLTNPDHVKAQKVMKAMLEMKKLDISTLKKAANS